MSNVSASNERLSRKQRLKVCCVVGYLWVMMVLGGRQSGMCYFWRSGMLSGYEPGLPLCVTLAWVTVVRNVSLSYPMLRIALVPSRHGAGNRPFLRPKIWIPETDRYRLAPTRLMLGYSEGVWWVIMVLGGRQSGICHFWRSGILSCCTSKQRLNHVAHESNSSLHSDRLAALTT